ncbi:MAG: rane protein-like protein [Thermoleophilia bacterium]|nr:rane protein-like protein [Thermoleophilia bacterium]
MPAAAETAPPNIARVPWWGVTLLAAIAALLRGATAGSQSLWYDEVFTAWVVEGHWGGLLERVTVLETTPPAYYVVVKLLVDALGSSELVLRLLSIVSSALLVWLGIRVAELLAPRAGGAAGWWAGALLAVNPFLVWFGQEARVYALLALATLGLVWATLHWLEQDSWRRAGVWTAWATLTVLAHYPGWVYVAAAGVVLLVGRGIGASRGFDVRRLAVAAGIVIVVAAAQLPLLLDQAAGARTDWIDDASLPRRLALVPQQLMTGLESPAQNAVAGALLLLLGALLVYGVRRLGRPARRVVLGFVVLPIVVLVIAALVGEDLIVTRNLIGLLPLLLIVAAIGAVGRWRLVAAALTVGFLALSFVITLDPDYRRPDWQGAVERAEAQQDDGPLALRAVPELQGELIRYYAETPAVDVTGDDATLPHETYLVGDVIGGGAEFVDADVAAPGMRCTRGEAIGRVRIVTCVPGRPD